jgi:hypothetical protein
VTKLTPKDILTITKDLDKHTIKPKDGFYEYPMRPEFYKKAKEYLNA